jgi:ubiquinone/menaquinone biosynthesis C-methylase UbiE
VKAFRQPISGVQGAGENLPFSSEKFDVVTMIEVLEHTNSDRQVLKECFRVLKAGGLLVLFVPNKLYPFESHPCHIGAFDLGPNIPLFHGFLKPFASTYVTRESILAGGSSRWLSELVFKY